MWNVVSKPFAKHIVKKSYNYFLESTSDPFPNPPFILIANHGTFFDPWIVGSYSKHPLAYMVNDDGFREKNISQLYLRSIGAFPKKKGASDFKAMKKTIELLNENYPVCIFPEGQTTWDGETQLLYRGIEKIVKKIKCPLVMVNLRGNFLTKPWWAYTTRKGKISLRIKVLQPEVIEKLSNDELFATLKTAIYQNDIKNPENLAYPFSGTRLAEGLERFVWICMHCGKEDTLHTEGDLISCSACKSTWKIDAHCRLQPTTSHVKCMGDLKDWADMHKQRVQENIATCINTLLTHSDKVIMQVENQKQIFQNGPEGSLYLTPTELRFQSSESNQTWPINELQDCVIQKKDLFEITWGSKEIRFLFNKKSPMKWVYYLRYLKGFRECEDSGHM